MFFLLLAHKVYKLPSTLLVYVVNVFNDLFRKYEISNNGYTQKYIPVGITSNKGESFSFLLFTFVLISVPEKASYGRVVMVTMILIFSFTSNITTGVKNMKFFCFVIQDIFDEKSLAILGLWGRRRSGKYLENLYKYGYFEDVHFKIKYFRLFRQLMVAVEH